MHNSGNKYTPHGFTLIEMMVVISIVAIIASMAVPSFQSTLDRQRVSTVAGDLHASVVLARAEAIRRNTRVELAPSDLVNWENGWQVSVPAVGATAAQVIYSRPAVPTGVAITPNLNPAGEASLSYDGTGKSRLATVPTSQRSGDLTISIPARPTAPKRKLAINSLGRPSLCDPAQPPC